MKSPTRTLPTPFRSRWRRGTRLPSWSASAWVAIAATLGFIALTIWWLSQDRSIPIFDSGFHLERAIIYHNMIQAGEILGPFNSISQYPPLATLVGSIGMFIGGINVRAPIIAENIVFVPMLALGCYQTGKLLFGKQAGMLAVLFVLGSPLLSSQFHTFLLDPPEDAMVALAMWLTLATDDFDRVGMSAIAGLAVGCGMLVKVTFAQFLGGIILVMLARRAWRMWSDANRSDLATSERLPASSQPPPSSEDPGGSLMTEARFPNDGRSGLRLTPALRKLTAVVTLPDLLDAVPVAIMDVVGVALAIFTALLTKGAVKGGLGLQENVQSALHLLPLPALLTVVLFAYSGLYTTYRHRASRVRILANLAVVTVVTLIFAALTAEQFHTYYTFGASLALGVLYVSSLRWLYDRAAGLVMFAAIAIVVAAPWYIVHISEFSFLVGLAGAESGAAPGNIPPTFSSASLLWYFWSTLNSQLGLWLFALALGGAIWTVVAVVRHRDARWVRIELLIGLLLAWLAVTLTPHKDIRYDMSLMPFLAVIGTGWIAHLARPARLALAGAVVLAVVANTLGSTFGVGEQVQVSLTKHPPATEAEPDQIVLYGTGGLGLAGPERDGDVPDLLKALKAEGVSIVAWNPAQVGVPDFSKEGLAALLAMAGEASSPDPSSVTTGSTVAALVHMTPRAGAEPPCSRLSDGSGVWLVRLNPVSRKVELFCPRHRPQYTSPAGPLGHEALVLADVPRQGHH